MEEATKIASEEKKASGELTMVEIEPAWLLSSPQTTDVRAERK